MLDYICESLQCPNRVRILNVDEMDENISRVSREEWYQIRRVTSVRNGSNMDRSLAIFLKMGYYEFS